MKKLTSYQKLQEKIKKLKKQKNELIKVIVEDDYHGLNQVKQLHALMSETEKAVFFGESDTDISVMTYRPIVFDKDGKFTPRNKEEEELLQKRIKTTHGSARVDMDCPQETIKALDILSVKAYEHFEENIHINHAKRVKLKYKIPMKQIVVDEYNQIWNYNFNNGSVIYYYYGQSLERLEDETINFSPFNMDAKVGLDCRCIDKNPERWKEITYDYRCRVCGTEVPKGNRP